MNYIRNEDENGMNEYDRQTVVWNQSNRVAHRRELRSNAINNTAGYHTGNRIHHIRSIQVPSQQIWDNLFRYENLNQSLREYAQAAIDFNEDQTNTLLFAGQMDVSLIMQENYRPGVHVAIFIIQLTPHREFHDGHVIQLEFGEGSLTHQTINRMFNTEERAVVSQATEYSILEYLADDNEMLDLLHSCFMDQDFNTMRFSYVEPLDPNEEYGYYIVDPNARNDHRVHYFNAGDNENDNDYYDEDEHVFAAAPVIPVENENQRPAIIAIPPPPPVNDFAEMYYYYYDLYNNDINYEENYYDHNNDNELPAQG